MSAPPPQGPPPGWGPPPPSQGPSSGWGPPPPPQGPPQSPPQGPPPGWGPPSSQPPWPPYGPPTPPRRSGPRVATILIAVGAAFAVLLVSTVGTVWFLGGRDDSALPAPQAPVTTSARPTGSPTSSASPSSTPSASPSSSPSSTAKPSPTPKPTPTPSEPTPSYGLEDNSIYDINLPAGKAKCSITVKRAKPPLKNSALAPYLRDVVDCFVKVFKPALAKQGFELTTPKIKTYKKSIDTDCGTLTSDGSPAYYCSGTIYWPVSSDDDNEAYTYARLGYVGLAAHEFGHHLQATTGMFSEYGTLYADASKKERYELSRRLELQAQCFEGVFLTYASKEIDLSSYDRTELREWHSYTGDEDPPSTRKPDHGTSKNQVAWLEKGMAGADFGKCNTWSASSKSVK